ncbi:RCC1 domain-containing protein 1 isoform X2 [Danio aesculapii]|uniref:RCC1 domain-containing protein 1 isoform X2 n=1 Tax=Danio aesculapii TaxID=1142201 RepID=UPI0024C00A84|nr:RCC1 domain-containing protein 1 isoform X2 [Danio aesculapii]
MSWFGFGFNGFGQISRADVNGQVKCKVKSPVLISGDECESGVNRSDCRIRACWSSRADLQQTSGSGVCLSGCVCASSAQVCESQGCTDALISETHLTLSFTDRVELWEIKRPQNQLVWKKEHELSEHTAALPLVSGGFVQHKPPFFRPLKLCAVSLALGSEHALLLTADGTLYSWGSGSHGQLGHGALTSLEDPQAVEALWGVPIRAVAAGNWHSAAISFGGDLYMWGWNESGQLGLPSRGLEEEKHRRSRSGNGDQPINTDEKSQTDVFISIQAFPALLDIANMSEISRISCGSRHTAAVTSSGDLYTWGWGQYGQLGHGTEYSTDEPTPVDYFSSRRLSVKDVVCGSWNTFVSVVPKKNILCPDINTPGFIKLLTNIYTIQHTG